MNYRWTFCRIRQIGSPLAQASRFRSAGEVCRQRRSHSCRKSWHWRKCSGYSKSAESMTKIVDACIARASDDTIEGLVKAMSSTLPLPA